MRVVLMILFLALVLLGTVASLSAVNSAILTPINVTTVHKETTSYPVGSWFFNNGNVCTVYRKVAQND